MPHQSYDNERLFYRQNIMGLVALGLVLMLIIMYVYPSHRTFSNKDAKFDVGDIIVTSTLQGKWIILENTDNSYLLKSWPLETSVTRTSHKGLEKGGAKVVDHSTTAVPPSNYRQPPHKPRSIIPPQIPVMQPKPTFTPQRNPVAVGTPFHPKHLEKFIG